LNEKYKAAAQGWAAFPRKSRDAISAGLRLSLLLKALFFGTFFFASEKESTS